MSRISGFVIAVLVVLIAGILVAGCTDSSSATTPPAQTAAITTTPASVTPLYSAGDIVRSSKGSADTGWLILKYDTGSDAYERAFIYRNADGTWGYRLDSRTENSGRAGLEKVNTVKVTHVEPSQIPLKQPTVATTMGSSSGTGSGSVTTTSTSVTTKTLGLRPQIKDIAPDNGQAGTVVAITDLLGSEFQTGASVILARSGSANITATNVNVVSSSHISCTFTIPADAYIGPWDLVVVNPDGQSTRISNDFIVRVNSNPTATTTTTTTSSTGSITITSIDPISAFSDDYKPVTVYGSNFKDGITCKLARSGSNDVPASTVSRTSETQMQCFFTIPTGSYGTWNLVLTNFDGTTGTLSNGFSVVT